MESNFETKETMMKKWGMYEWSVILFFIGIPLVLIVMECLLFKSALSLSEISLKWFVFSGVGLRLGSSGIMQITNPKFTAKDIFNIQEDAALPLVKEVGFANISFSILALLSLCVPAFRVPAAIAGGSYFGFAGLLHIFQAKTSDKEWFAMLSDMFIFVILAVCIVVNLI